MDLEARLLDLLRGLSPGLLLYSGGIDSRTLLEAAKRSGGRFAALHFTGPQLTPAEASLTRARLIASGVPHTVLEASPLDDPQAAANLPDRCYHCKRRLLELARDQARKAGFVHLLDGSNAGDAAAHRPGRRALAEYEVHSPLAEAGLSKADVRDLARFYGLADPDQPSRACLFTRFPYGTAPDVGLLDRLGRAEDALSELGLRNFRVRLFADKTLLQVGKLDSAWGATSADSMLAPLRKAGFPAPELVLLDDPSGFFDQPPTGAEG